MILMKSNKKIKRNIEIIGTTMKYRHFKGEAWK